MFSWTISGRAFRRRESTPHTTKLRCLSATLERTVHRGPLTGDEFDLAELRPVLGAASDRNALASARLTEVLAHERRASTSSVCGACRPFFRPSFSLPVSIKPSVMHRHISIRRPFDGSSVRASSVRLSFIRPRGRSLVRPIVRTSVRPSVRLSVRPSVVHLSTCSFVNSSTRPVVRPYVRHAVRPSIRAAVRPYVHLFHLQFIRLTVRPIIDPSLRPPFKRPSWFSGYTLGCWCEGYGVQFPGRPSIFKI